MLTSCPLLGSSEQFTYQKDHRQGRIHHGAAGDRPRRMSVLRTARRGDARSCRFVYSLDSLAHVRATRRRCQWAKNGLGLSRNLGWNAEEDLSVHLARGTNGCAVREV